MTTVYLVIVDESHTDAEPEVFSTAEAAITFAREKAVEYASDPADIEESDAAGWLYYAEWPTEGDRVWVVEKTVRDEGS